MRNATLITFASTLLLALLIAGLTLTPSDALPNVAGTDKLHHTLAFMSLAFPTALLRPRWGPAVALVLAGYGGLIEVIQPYVSRSRDFADWEADLIGIALGSALGLGLNYAFRWRPRLQS